MDLRKAEWAKAPYEMATPTDVLEYYSPALQALRPAIILDKRQEISISVQNLSIPMMRTVSTRKARNGGEDIVLCSR